jgi:hypothetical protein
VLRPGGRFLIWDASFGPRPEDGKTVGVVPLTVKLPDREISTGYGVRWPDEPHDLAYYRRLVESTGFSVVRAESKDRWLSLELKKN